MAEEQEEAQFRIPPWLMWGNTQIIDLDSNDGANYPTKQLIKISHNRPDMWQWLFHAKLVAAPNVPPTSTVCSVVLWWDVITGLGRSAVTMPMFDQWWWWWGNATVGNVLPPPLGQVMWSTSTKGPAHQYIFGPVLDDAGRRQIQQIPGQDLTVNVRGYLSVGLPVPGVSYKAQVEVSAYMTPNCGAPDIKIL